MQANTDLSLFGLVLYQVRLGGVLPNGNKGMTREDAEDKINEMSNVDLLFAISCALEKE